MLVHRRPLLHKQPLLPGRIVSPLHYDKQDTSAGQCMQHPKTAAGVRPAHGRPHEGWGPNRTADNEAGKEGKGSRCGREEAGEIGCVTGFGAVCKLWTAVDQSGRVWAAKVPPSQRQRSLVTPACNQAAAHHPGAQAKPAASATLDLGWSHTDSHQPRAKQGKPHMPFNSCRPRISYRPRISTARVRPHMHLHSCPLISPAASQWGCT